MNWYVAQSLYDETMQGYVQMNAEYSLFILIKF